VGLTGGPGGPRAAWRPGWRWRRRRRGYTSGGAAAPPPSCWPGCGRQLLVGAWSVTRDSEFQILEVNCAPLSDVMMAGTPNLQIYPENNAAATSAAALLARESASIQWLVLSITVMPLTELSAY
jgi:hypothetical protein